MCARPASGGWIGWIVLFLVPAMASEGMGQGSVASPNVPLHHWTYEALEQLATEGELERWRLDHRPLTRWDMAQAAALQRMVRDLEETFREELRELEGGDRTAPIALSYAQAEVLLMGATSDIRPNREAEVPFLFEQGLNLGLGAQMGVTITPSVLVFADGYVHATRDGLGARVRTGYVKLHLGGTEIQIGRGETWFGPGYHGDFVLTDNAPAVDRIQVSQRLGSLYGCVLAGTLKDQPVGHPISKADVLLGGFRVAWTYADRLRLEADISSLSRGTDRIWEDMRSLWQTGVSEVNQVGEVGITYWPVDGVKVYAATAGDDFWAVGPARRIIPWGRKNGYLVGVYASDLLGNGRLDGRWEYTRFVEERGDNWYTHGVPYLYDGWVIGHPSGHSEYGRASNERDLFLRTTYRGRGATWGLTLHRAWGTLPPGDPQELYHIALDVDTRRGGWEVGMKALLLMEKVRGDRWNEGRWILHLRRRLGAHAGG